MASTTEEKTLLEHNKALPEDNEKKSTVVKIATYLKWLKFKKRTKNTEKPMPVLEKQEEKKVQHVPELRKNDMGTSAAAGSAESHVYRNLQKKEYGKEKNMKGKGGKALLGETSQQQMVGSQRTSKKRAKKVTKTKTKKKPKLSKDNKTEKKFESDTYSTSSDEDEELK